MATPTLITGTVPADSPLRALTGRTVTVVARTRPEIHARVTELRRAGIDPTVWTMRTTSWVPAAAALTGGVLGSLVASFDAILAGDTADAWAAAVAMVLLGLLLFPVVARIEREADR